MLQKGCTLGIKNGRHALLNNNQVVFYAKIKNNVLMLDHEELRTKLYKDLVLSAISASVKHPSVEPQRGSLMHNHLRFGHMSLDDVERLVKDPRNGIEMTDHLRRNCLTCAEGAQPKKGTGQGSPIDVVGEP